MADNFNLRQFLSENKLTKNAKLLKEQEELSYPFGEFGQAVKDVFEQYNEEAISDAPDIVFELIDELIQEYDLDSMSGEINTELMEARLLELYKAAQTMDTEEFGEFAYNELSDGSLFIGGDEDDYDEEDLDEAAPESMQGGFDMVAKASKEKEELQAVANRMFPEFGGKLTSLGAPLTPEQRDAVWATWSKEKVAQEKAEREAMQESLTAKERRLVEMVHNALGVRTDDAENPTMEEGGEMADETVIPEYKTIEELMKEIDKGTNRVAEQHKVQEMKKIAKALRAEAQRMEESEHAKHINPKVRKKYLQDAIKIEKAAEKLVAALEKEAKKDKPAAAPKAEKVEALQEGTFDLRKFLAENKLTANSRMLNEEIKFIDANDPVLKSGGTEDLKPEDLQSGKTVIILKKSYRDRNEVEANMGIFTRIDDKGYVYWKTKDGKEKTWPHIEDLALVKNL